MPDRIRVRGFPLRSQRPPGAAGLPSGLQARRKLPSPPGEVPGLTLTPEYTMDDGYDLLLVRIRRGTTVNGAVVALCPDADGVVTADVCIDGPPVP